MLRALILLLAALLASCASVYEPVPLDLPGSIDDLQTKSSGPVNVSAGILTDQQALSHFGLNFGDKSIQAIWLRIANGSDKKLWFLRNALDPDYFSADEVASLLRNDIPAELFESVRQRLRDESIRVSLEPGTVYEGFVFAPKAIGGRYVDVRLGEDIFAVERERRMARARNERSPLAKVSELRFGFAIPLPDGIFDYEQLHPESIYPEGRPNLTPDEFRTALEALPCCATNEDKDASGDPLNIVVVASAGEALNSLSRAGWSFTHRITAESVRRLIGASIQGESYPVAPVSNLYLFDRKQDFALQRARPSIAQRNHMRVWLAPFTFREKNVWVGQVSRDIGVKLTTKSSTLTTHVIDPEVDLTREYLLHSLLAEGFVDSFGFVSGSQAATREQPAENLTGDPYFSDGLRAVVVLSPDPIPYERVGSLMWEESAAPVAEGQTETAEERVHFIPPD